MYTQTELLSKVCYIKLTYAMLDTSPSYFPNTFASGKYNLQT